MGGENISTEALDHLYSISIFCELWRSYFSCIAKFEFLCTSPWDHPFKTSAFFSGGGVKNLPNLPMDISIKNADGGG